MTVRDIITKAFILCGTIGFGQSLDDAYADQGLDILTDLFDGMRVDRLVAYYQGREVFPFVASQANYTMGPSGNFNTVRPSWIDDVTVLDTSVVPNFEYPPLALPSDDEWVQYRLKALASTVPRACYVNATSATLITLSFWPVPTGSTYSAVIYAPRAPITATPTLDTDISLPPGYLGPIKKLLAGQLSYIPAFAPSPRMDLLKAGSIELNMVKYANFRPGELTRDLPPNSAAAVYDYRSGEQKRIVR